MQEVISKIPYRLHLHRWVDLLGDGRHGVIHPIHSNYSTGDACHTLDTSILPAHQYGFHIKGHTEDSHAHPCWNFAQFLVECSQNWKQFVFERIQPLNWSVILADVRPFVEPGFDLGLLTRENLEKTLFKT